VNANLDLRLDVVVFGSPILLMDRIVGLDGYSGKWLAALRNSISNEQIVTHVREQRQYHDGGSNTEEYAFQSFLSLTGLWVSILIGANPGNPWPTLLDHKVLCLRMMHDDRRRRLLRLEKKSRG
jgi:hypothetical protein